MLRFELQEILSAKKEIEAIMKEKNNLEKSLEMKDDENLKINNELKRMRIVIDIFYSFFLHHYWLG